MNNPLHAASNIDIVKLLINKAINNYDNRISKISVIEYINIKNYNGDTPLHKACDMNYIDIVRLLIENGADINIKNYNGDTPLHKACDMNYIDIVKLLIENGADINIKDNEGNTPLHKAYNNVNFEISEYLLNINPNLINIKNNNGETPLQIKRNY